MGMRRYVRPMMNSVRKVFPSGYFFALYNNASKRISAQAGERDRAFAAFLSRSEGKHCLQISVKDEIGHKFGSIWVSVDKYDDRAFIDRHDDVENLEFPDGSFDAAVCWSVLEHVPHPDRAIAELLREAGHQVDEVAENDEWPEVGRRVGEAVACGQADRGIVW